MTTELLLRAYPDLLFAYQQTSMLVTSRDGAIQDGLQGLYDHDLRLLSKHRLFVHAAARGRADLDARRQLSGQRPPPPEGGRTCSAPAGG